MRRREVATAVVVVLAAITPLSAVRTAAYASDARCVQLLTTTTTGTLPDGATETEPFWEIQADRAMAVQLSSEDSVAACERTLSEGYESCQLLLGGCMRMTISLTRKVPFVLSILPARCGGEQLSWWLGGRDDTADKTIPVVPRAGSPPADEPH
jgi:hypothetical protein